MKNILVTGGAGYIGSHAVRLLAESGYNPIIVDDLSRGFEKLAQGRQIIKGNIGDYSFLSSVFKKYDFDSVMHFAAFALVGESVKEPLKYFRNNTVSSINLIKVMLENRVTKLIYSSTAATYGEPLETPIKEDHPTNPINPYGESKLAFEKILEHTSQASDLRYATVRYFNVAGAHESGEIGEMHDPETHIVPLAIEAALKNREFSIYGDDYDTKDGTCIRDYIHPNDLIKAHMLALEHIDKHGENKTYNMGNDEGFSVKEVLKAVEKVTDKKLKTRVIKRRPGDPAILVASSEKIKKELSWQPDYPDIAKIIDTAFKWHKNNWKL